MHALFMFLKSVLIIVVIIVLLHLLLQTMQTYKSFYLFTGLVNYVMCVWARTLVSKFWWLYAGVCAQRREKPIFTPVHVHKG